MNRDMTFSVGSRGRTCGRFDDLVDAIMVEPDRNAAWGDEHGDAFAENGGAGMVDLESPAAVQFDREYPKRIAGQHGFQELIEVFGCHRTLLLITANSRA